MTRLRLASPLFARLVAVGLLLLLAVSIFAFPVEAPTQGRAVSAVDSDAGLYRGIVNDVGAGRSYYDAMAEAHRAKGYPLRPIMTVRLPTLAWLSAALGPTGTQLLMTALVILTLAVWFRQLKLTQPLLVTAAALLIMMLSIIPIAQTSILLFHESWAGLLVALALGLWKEERPWAGVAVALVAALFRESAMPILPMMAFFAILSKRWREASAWCGAFIIWGIAYAAHYGEVAALVRPDDLASPGWSGLGGWPLFVDAVFKTTPLAFLPPAFASPLTLLALLGWLSVRSGLALRVAGWLFGMAVMIMLFARPDNFYWAALPMPLILAGLAFVPLALVDLWHALMGSDRRLDLEAA
jgi:hypothetical protein